MSRQPPSSTAEGPSGATHRLGRGFERFADASTSNAVSDELAALFLGEPETDAEAPAARAEPRTQPRPEGVRSDGADDPTVGLLVLGNLPVFAGAWASQYARDRQAGTGRPLALLTVSDDAARLEIFGAAVRSTSARLEGALAEAARLGADLLVRLPEAEAGWISGSAGVERLTLLTGADDPAIVAAYKSLKSIVQELPAESNAPELSVAIAGCPPEAASVAAAKLAQAASRFMSLRVGSEAPVVQIDAGASTELYHGAPPDWADIPDLLAHFTRPGTMERASASVGEDRPRVEVVRGAHEAASARHLAKPVGFEAQGAHGVAVPPVKEAESDTAAVDEDAPMQATDERALPQGMHAVEVSCPYARSVRIAVDDRGRLHAFAWARDTDRSSGAIRDLVVASSWLRDHTELVAVVLGRRLADAPGERHLVLADARGALGLAQGELRVHVATRGNDALVDLN
jgi:hypothetical protein